MTTRTSDRTRERWSAADIPNQTGRTAVVTGANSGLGFHTCVQLARAGARVTMACRDPERGRAALERLRAQVPAADVTLAGLDLADLSSVRAFAAGWLTGHEHLDVLVNNAGVMAIPLRRTADGFEMQLGTNHLGHFALTGLLLPALLTRAPGGQPNRVVTVSSGAHRFGSVNLADLNWERGYRKWLAYGRSKLANLLFMRELDHRASAVGAPLVSVAAHPGLAATNLTVAGPLMSGRPWLAKINVAVSRVIAQSDAAGALPSLRAATDPGVVGGEYFGPDGPGEFRGFPVRVPMAAAARDDAMAGRLWAASESLTGVTFPALPPAA
jgi:NAD(P)-dependent dehydrogenase (short-subunit alcohol dehydrogenase family)